MHYWRKLIISLLFLTITTITIAAQQQLDRISTIVNNDVILQSDIDNMLAIVKINAKNTGQQIPEENKLRHQILEYLIIDKIIMQIGQKIQIQIPPQAIDTAIANIAAQNGLTTSQLEQQLKINGIDLENYRNNIYREIMITEVRNNEVFKRFNILPQEVDSLAAKLSSQAGLNANINLSHILIPLPKNPNNQQIQLSIDTVNKIITQLKNGADFGKLAITYSADTNALKGGQMGWNKVAELPTIFAQQIQHAKKGDIIGAIRSNTGFHIFKINDIQHKNIPISVIEVKVRHILIKESDVMNKTQALKTIRQIEQKIKTNQMSFADGAKKYSQDPSSKLNGGDLGWNIIHVYEPTLRHSLMKLNKGEISQPIHSSFGWHLLQLEDKRQVDKTDIAQKEYAYYLLFNRKFNAEAQIWIQEIRASAYVKIINNSDL